MLGEEIIARSITAARIPDAYGNQWQYHSRSDRHSKVACWAIMFDLLRSCELLQRHVASGKVGFGINHEMRDFRQDRKKNLDLVLCKHATEPVSSFPEYGSKCSVMLTEPEQAILETLPSMRMVAAVSNVLVALEAKACMTEHIKALPRLHDELASSHQTIHGDTAGAIAAGFIMVNSANAFNSPDRNRKRVRGGKFVTNLHKQPLAAQRTLELVKKLPRRSDPHASGFDALGVSVINCLNDGTSVVIDEAANEDVPDILKYPAFVRRIAHLYATKFGGI